MLSINKATVESFIRFIGTLHNNQWYENLSILEETYPSGKRLVLCYENPNESYSKQYLRHSIGPHQGYFWDIYGDDLHSEEMILWILSQYLPRPPRSRWK